MTRLLILKTIACVCVILAAAGCDKKGGVQEVSAAGTGPAAVTVEPDQDANNFKVDHPDRFPLATASEHVAAPELNVNGVVSPDVSRQLPVPSLATGRVVEIDARLGDEVKGSVAVQSAQLGYSGRVFGLSQGRQERTARRR
jgi:cobalt-zinc-cadmium efflux system membrane fusion protein